MRYWPFYFWNRTLIYSSSAQSSSLWKSWKWSAVISPQNFLKLISRNFLTRKETPFYVWAPFSCFLDASKVSLLNVWMKLLNVSEISYMQILWSKSKYFREINFRKILQQSIYFWSTCLLYFRNNKKEYFLELLPNLQLPIVNKLSSKKTSKFTDNSYWWDITLLCTKAKKTRNKKVKESDEKKVYCNYTKKLLYFIEYIFIQAISFGQKKKCPQIYHYLPFFLGF